MKSVIGPSVCLPPEPFFNRGVDYIGGALVEESFYRTMLTEDLRDDWKTFNQKKEVRALKFGNNKGIRKIGILKK